MLKKILIGAAVVIAAFLAFVATRPAEYEVAREALIPAPAAVAYAQVADFHKWDAWSPWAKLDPQMKTSFEGTPGAVGSSQSWTGNKDVGTGKMTLLEAKPGELVRIKLEFVEPFADTADNTITFRPEGAGTRVRWSMAGVNNFMEKAMCVFMDMDAMIGKDFEKGLAQLGAVAQAEAAKGTAGAATPKP
jgi:Polyketide cyclase / dehydrase and lipid transport